jgi:hypothetical protein
MAGEEQRDIKRGWLNVARRLQSVACTENRGCAFMRIDVLVQGDEPVFWFPPTIKKFEPRGTTTGELLERLANMCGEPNTRDFLTAILDFVMEEAGGKDVFVRELAEAIAERAATR